MSQAYDNPLKRFAATWLALALFASFALLALVFAPLFNKTETTAADQSNAARRLAIRQEVEAAQAQAMATTETGDKVQVAPSKIFNQVGAKLAANRPSAVQDESQKVAVPTDAATPDSTEQATPEQ